MKKFNLTLLSLALISSSLAFSSESKTIVLTGGSRGLGGSLCTSLRSQGHKVYCGAPSFSVSTYETPKSDDLYLDFRDKASVDRFVSYISSKAKQVDVLLNVAAINVLGKYTTVSTDQFSDVMNVNFIGPVSLIKAFAPKMKGGMVFNISSSLAIAPFPGFDAYVASKAALEAFSESASIYGDTTFKIVVSGPIKSDFMLKSTSLGEDHLGDEAGQAFLTKAHPAFIANVEKSGQDPQEITDMIIEEINKPTEKLRLYVSEYVKTGFISKFGTVVEGSEHLGRAKDMYNAMSK